MTEQQYYDITKWQDETFPKSTALSRANHLCKEAKELIYELRIKDKMGNHGGENRTRMEFADCFILLFGAAKAYGLTYHDICQLINEKHEINKKRKWGEPDKDGVVNHVKE